jgi:hypothetical protein
VKVGGKWGYIDRSGKMVIQPQFEYAGPFSEGLAVVQIEGKLGYIDKSGKIVITPQFFLYSRNFDESGKIVFKPMDKNIQQFDIAQSFYEGLAAVPDKENKYGYIDQTGAVVIPPQFFAVGPFSQGLAPVLVNEPPSSLGYIDKRGQMVIKPRFPMREMIEGGLVHYSFCGGIAQVPLGAPDATGYINKEGKLIWPPGK